MGLFTDIGQKEPTPTGGLFANIGVNNQAPALSASPQLNPLNSANISGSTAANPAPGTVGDPLAAFVHAPPRAILSSGITLAEGAGALTGKKIAPEYTPTGPVATKIFGKEPVRSIGTESVDFANKANIPLPAATFGVLAGVALDLTPFGGEKNALKAITATKDITEAAKIGRQIGVSEDLLKGFSEAAVKANDTNAAKKVIDYYTELQKTSKAPVTPKLARNADIPGPAGEIDPRLASLADKDGMITVYRSAPKFPTDTFAKDTHFATDPRNARYYAESHYEGDPNDLTIRSIKVPASQLKRGGSADSWQLVTDHPVSAVKASESLATDVQRAGNIRLDKFNLPEEAKTNLAKIIDDNQGFMDQRRGVRSFAETNQLAQEIVPRTRLRAGTALNAEELQSLGNAVASMQAKVDHFAQMVTDPAQNTLVNQARLMQAKNELSYGLASLSGATAESGRALTQLRNLRNALLSNDSRLLQDAVRISEGRIPAEDIARKLIDFGDDNLGKLRYLRTLQKVGTVDKIYEIFINSILSNPVTHAVNLTGNSLMALLKVPTRTVQAGLESFKGSNRSVFFGEVPELVIGAAEGMTEGIRKALFVLRNGISAEHLSKLDVQHLPAIKGTTGEVIRTPTKLLQAADDFFKAVVGTAELRAQAYRAAKKEGLRGEAAIKRMHDLIADPPKSLIDSVDFEKLEATFQSPLGKYGNAVMNLRNKAPGVRYIIPFIKTPVNIAKAALQFSPAGYGNVTRKIFTGAYKDLPVGQLSKELAQATMGSAMALPVVLGALHGNVTGAAPTNAAERDAFYRSGKQPYSIKIGDKWYSYRRVEPLATVIGLVTDMTNLTKDKDISSAAVSAIALIGRNLNDKTFMSGISAFIDALTDPVRYGDQWLNRTVSGTIPFSGAQRFAAQLTDPVIRQPEGLVETIKANTPGLSSQVPSRLDAFGGESRRTLSQVTSPIGITSEKNDAVDTELARIGVTMTFPAQKQFNTELSRDEYRNFQQKAGQITKQVLATLIASPGWEALPDSTKAEQADKVITKIRSAVRDQVLQEQKLRNEIDKRLEKANVPEDKRPAVIKEIVSKVK